MKKAVRKTRIQESLFYARVFPTPSLPCISWKKQKRTGPTEKNLEMMRKFSEQYARGSNTYFCVDKSVTAVVIQGLAEHKDTLGAPLCPCRHYDDKAGLG